METLALKIIGIIALFLAFLGSLKATVTIAYSDDIALWVRVLFIKIKILPAKDKRKKIHSMSKKKALKIRRSKQEKEEKKRREKLRKKQEKEEKKKQKQNEPKQKKSLSEIMDMTSMVLDLVKAVISTFFGHLRVKVARFKITLASPDPAITAIAYGTVTQTVSYIVAALSDSKHVKGIKKKNIDIRTDFLSDTPIVDVKISFSIRVWHVFHVAFAALGRLLRSKFIKDKLKGISKPEQKEPTQSK